MVFGSKWIFTMVTFYQSVFGMMIIHFSEPAEDSFSSPFFRWIIDLEW